MTEGKQQFSLVIDAFLRFIQVSPVESTDATHTIEAITNFITFFGIPQEFVYDRGTSVLSTDFSTSLWNLALLKLPERNGHLGQWESSNTK